MNAKLSISFKIPCLLQRDGVFFISGDVHFGEITRYDCACAYPLFDITSSGLTQAVEKAVPSPLHFFVRFVAWWTPAPLRVMNRHCRYRSCTFGMLVNFQLELFTYCVRICANSKRLFSLGQPNFGAIEIHWDATPVMLRIEIRDMDGFPVTGVNISLPELQAQKVNSFGITEVGEYGRHCYLEVTLPWIVRYRLAILFYSMLSGVLTLT